MGIFPDNFTRSSFQPEDLAALLGDHGLVPGRVPDDFDDGFFDTGKVKEFLLGVAGDGCTHAATGRSEGHFDGDKAVATGERFDVEIVNEAQVNDVDGDFGVVTGFERFPEELFVGGTFDDRPGRRGRGGFKAKGVRVSRIEAEETTVGADSVGTAEHLGNVHRGAGGQGDGIATGYLNGAAIALEIDGGDLMHTKKV